MDFLSYREQLGIGLCDNKKISTFSYNSIQFLERNSDRLQFFGNQYERVFTLLQYNWNANKQYVYE